MEPRKRRRIEEARRSIMGGSSTWGFSWRRCQLRERSTTRQCWGKKMNNKFDGVEEAPGSWSKALGAWAKNQRTFGKAFKKPASQRSEAEKANASKTTKRRVALLDGIGFFT